MKKLISLFLALTMILCLYGCGAKSSYAADYAMYEAAAEPSEAYYSDDYNGTGGFAVSDEAEGSSLTEANVPGENPEKIIYAASANIETIEFDKSISDLNKLVEKYGGWVQTSSVNGANYYDRSRGNKALRSAEYTIRIPSGKFNTIMNSLSTLGNVPYSHVYSENVTAEYYDVEARLKACRTQETALLGMMEKAESVSDIITIEDRLTELRYQIESLQSSLNNWDRRVSYSTISLRINEVEEYTPEPEVIEGYWQKMWNGFVGCLSGVGNVFKGLLMFLVTALPVLAVLAAGFFIVRAIIKRHRKTEKRAKADKKRPVNPVPTPGTMPLQDVPDNKKQ